MFFTKAIRDLYTSRSLNDFANIMDTKWNGLSGQNLGGSKKLTKLVKTPSDGGISIMVQKEATTLKANFHIMMEVSGEFQIGLPSSRHKARAIELEFQEISFMKLMGA